MVSCGVFTCKIPSLRLPLGFKSEAKPALNIQTAMESSEQPQPSSATVAKGPKVVVCGGGVIGVCSAYFLAKKGAQVTVVEKSGIACAASGKAGGFLALDWCDGGPASGLARTSFRLHQELAQDLDGANLYGYRALNTLRLSVDEQKQPASQSMDDSLRSWIDGPVSGAISIGTTDTTAQVHPHLFTRTVFSAAVEKYGANLVIGELQEVVLDENNGVTGVLVNGELISADVVVLALGPWSSKNTIISSLFTISGLKAHSIVLRTQNPNSISPHALFLHYRTAEGKSIEPEVYPRPTGEVYICGMAEELEVPDDPQQVLPRKEPITILQRVARTISSQLASADVQAEQACFLPCSDDGKPVIGKIPDMNGAYVATGHSCWGILNAPATGASLADLILDGQVKIVDLKPFDPARFRRRSRRSPIL